MSFQWQRHCQEHVVEGKICENIMRFSFFLIKFIPKCCPFYFPMNLFTFLHIYRYHLIHIVISYWKNNCLICIPQPHILVLWRFSIQLQSQILQNNHLYPALQGRPSHYGCTHWDVHSFLTFISNYPTGNSQLYEGAMQTLNTFKQCSFSNIGLLYDWKSHTSECRKYSIKMDDNSGIN